MFYETFNDAGDGVAHVNVIWAERSRCLGFTGQVVFSRSVTELPSLTI